RKKSAVDPLPRPMTVSLRTNASAASAARCFGLMALSITSFVPPPRFVTCPSFWQNARGLAHRRDTTANAAAIEQLRGAEGEADRTRPPGPQIPSDAQPAR